MFNLDTFTQHQRHSEQQVTHLIHQHISSGIQPTCHAVIQSIFKPFLLSNHRVQEICLIYMRGLGITSLATHYTKYPLITYQFLIEIHLNHRLYHISNMYQFEELHKRSNTGRFLMVGGFILSHLLRSSKISFDYAVKKILKTKPH